MDYCHECQILGQRQDFRFTTKITCHANLSIVPNPMLETVSRVVEEAKKQKLMQRNAAEGKCKSLIRLFRLHSREKAVTKCDKICYDFPSSFLNLFLPFRLKSRLSFCQFDLDRKLDREVVGRVEITKAVLEQRGRYTSL